MHAFDSCVVVLNNILISLYELTNARCNVADAMLNCGNSVEGEQKQTHISLMQVFAKVKELLKFMSVSNLNWENWQQCKNTNKNYIYGCVLKLHLNFHIPHIRLIHL